MHKFEAFKSPNVVHRIARCRQESLFKGIPSAKLGFKKHVLGWLRRIPDVLHTQQDNSQMSVRATTNMIHAAHIMSQFFMIVHTPVLNPFQYHPHSHRSVRRKLHRNEVQRNQDVSRRKVLDLRDGRFPVQSLAEIHWYSRECLSHVNQV